MTLGQRIVVMRDGKLQQVGAPAEVYQNPENVFVAGFLGTPSMNLLTGRTEGGVVTTGRLRLVVPGAPDGDTILGIRPEGLHPTTTDDPGPCLDVVVSHVEALGNENLVHARIPDLPDAEALVVFRSPPRVFPQADERLRVRVDPSHGARVRRDDRASDPRSPDRSSPRRRPPRTEMSMRQEDRLGRDSRRAQQQGHRRGCRPGRRARGVIRVGSTRSPTARGPASAQPDPRRCGLQRRPVRTADAVPRGDSTRSRSVGSRRPPRTW